MIGLPFTKDEPFHAPKCPYCDEVLIRPTDRADPQMMVFHIVRISQHMIECYERLKTGQPPPLPPYPETPL